MVQDIFLGNKLRNKIYFLHCQPVYLKTFLEPRAHFSQSHILWNEFRFSPRPRGCALLPFPCAGRAVAAQGARFSCFSQTGPCFGLALSGDSSSWRSRMPHGRVFQGGFHPACEQYGAIAGWGHFWGWGGCFFPSNTAMAQQWPHQQRWSQRVAGEAARAALTPHRHRHGHWRLTPRAHSSQAMLDIPICHQSCSMSSCLPAFVLSPHIGRHLGRGLPLVLFLLGPGASGRFQQLCDYWVSAIFSQLLFCGLFCFFLVNCYFSLISIHIHLPLLVKREWIKLKGELIYFGVSGC